MKEILFETNRLIIRKPIENDAKEIFANYTQDPEVVKYLSWVKHTKLEDSIKFINYCIQQWDSNTMLPFCIFHKLDNQVIGMLDFRFEDFKTYFGYVLSKKYWNQGLMTEAMKPVINFVFKMDNIYKIWAMHDIDNPASGKVMEKIGLEFDCIMKNWTMHPNISDKPRDCMIYSMNKEI